MLSVKYALTEADYASYYTFVMWDAPERKKTKVKYYLRQLLVNALIIAAILYSNLFRFQLLYVYAYAGIVVLGAAWQIFYSRTNIRQQGMKVAEDPENSALYLEVQLDINDSGINKKNSVLETKYSWQAFNKKEETPAHYFLFTSSVEALIIPKRIFKTAEEKQQFEKLMLQHLSLDAEVAHLMKR